MTEIMPEWPRGRGSWEPRGFYAFRWVLRIFVGMLALSVVLGSVAPMGLVIPLFIIAGIALAGIVFAFIGLIITAPTRKEGRRKKAEDKLTRPEQHF
jgi:hypothetical protein